MKLQNVSFEQWEVNHSADHDDKWCRELYPFHVFKRIEFCQDRIHVEQKIEFNNIVYYVSIKKIELQENGRYRTTIEMTTYPKSATQS